MSLSRMNRSRGLFCHLPALALACGMVMWPMAVKAAETNYRTWISSNGGTPTIDAGTLGTSWSDGYGPANAFNGVTSADSGGRYLGGKSSAADAYIIYGAEIAGQSFTMMRYRICQSTAGDYSNARAPSAWTLYGANSADAADDEWTQIDSRTGVAWSGTSFAAKAAIPSGVDCWREFKLETPSTYKFYKIAFSAAADPDYTGSWKIAVMEIEYLGDDTTFPYTFNAEESSDLADSEGWSCKEVPSAGASIRIRGMGTVNYNAESRRFASITVKDGATLAVSGGTTESPVDLPSVELDYDARLLLAEGSVVQITNFFTCVGMPGALPVLEVSTNATAIVQTPVPLSIRSSYDKYNYAGDDYGFRIKNVALRWYGDIQTYHGDTGARTEYCRLLLGWAEEGERSYIAIDCRGGRYIAAGEANSIRRSRTPLAMVIPQPSGVVVPVGTLYFRDYARVQRGSSAQNPEIYTPGFFVGRWNEYNSNTQVAGNPASVEFDVVFEGSVDLLMSGYCRIGGGARVTLRGSDVQWRYVRTAANDESLPRSLTLNDSATLTLEDGAYLDVCSSDAAYDSNASSRARGFNAKGTVDGQKMFSVVNSRMSLMQWYGSNNGVADLSDSVLEIGYLRSASTFTNSTGVLNGFKSVSISNTFAIAAADVDRGNPSKAGVIAIENWNRYVRVGPPLTGTGSLVVSNELSGAHSEYSMTVVVTNGANTATGRAFAAQTESGAPTALMFADGSNWAGEVVASGNVSLTNLVDEGAAASVTFGALRLDGDFPVRIWKSGSVVTNDMVNLSSALTGSGSFRFVEMEEPLSAGDKLEIGLYPASAVLPQGVKPFSYSTRPSAVEGYVKLVAIYKNNGLVIVVK